MNKDYIGKKKDSNTFKHIIRVMKITVFLFFFSVMLSHASTSHSQEMEISLNMRSTTLKEACKEIENQTGLVFVFADNAEGALNQKVNIRTSSQSIYNILDDLLSSRDLIYKIIDKQVVVFKEEKNYTTLEIPVSTLADIVKQINRTITGRVIDTNNEPLIGANIMELGTTNGTITDIDGYFTLQISEGAVITVSYIGYLPHEINTEGRNKFEFVLQEDMQSLEDLVVIGYGTRQKRDLTGAISQIDSDEITKRVALSPEYAMQGKMAGVFVGNSGSNPNARPTIRIRGVSTLGYNEPLYVIDGIPLSEGGSGVESGRIGTLRGDVNVFNMINPNDIESISVLKDASATAIYGVRASNGVILITTKRGGKGKAQINATASYGIQNIRQKYDLVSIDEYVTFSREAWANNTTTTPNADWAKLFDPQNPNYLGNSPDYSSDWRNAALVKNAPVQDYNLSIVGGTEVSNYAVGAGYSSQDDAIWKSNVNRYSFFLNSDHQLGKYFKVGESYRFVYSKTASIDGATGGLETMLDAPWQPLYNENDPNGLALPGRTIDGKFLSRGYGNRTRTNFLANELYKLHESGLMRNMGSFYAEFSPLAGLRFKGTFSFDTFQEQRDRLQNNNIGLFEADRGILYPYTGDTYGKTINENTNIVKEFLIGYVNNFGKHNVDIILNAMDQKISWNYLDASINDNSEINGWDQRRLEEGWPSDSKITFYERRPSGLQGYMGRFSYNYDSKYYLDATIRRDGSSKFGEGYKWGTFPSLAAVWRISSENFMSDISWLNDLKIRGGWGKTGNQETRDYAFLSVVNYNPKYALGSGALPGDGTFNPGAVLGDFPVTNMSWETVTSTSVAIDAIALNNKLSLTLEYYDRLTDGILQTIRIPRVIGALNSPVVNLAKVTNSGFEMQATYTDQFGPIGFSTSANLTTVKNRVDKLYEGLAYTTGNERIEEGYPVNFIYGYKTDGIFQTDSEVSSWLSNNTDPGKDSYKAPGDIVFVDLYGPPTDSDPDNALKNYAPDGRIDANDQTYLGKTIPGVYYGVSFELTYNNWDMSMHFRGVGDIQRINTQGKQSIAGGDFNFVTEYRNRWTPTNPSNTIPRAAIGDPSGNNRISDRHVENAGFLRFQNWQIGYNFKGNLLQRFGIGNLRTYIGGSNVFVITPYTGLDPENDTTPVTLMIGANINF